MALKSVVDTLDSVPEALRGEYTEQDGKFYLSVDDIDNHPGVAGLKSALHKERTNRGTAEKQISAWQKIGKTPEEIAEMLEKQAELETEAAKKRGDFDGILKQHQTKWDGEKQTLAGERDAAISVARKAVVDSGIKSALVGGNVSTEGMEILPEILGKRIKTEFVDGEFVSTIVQADGKTPMIGSGPNNSATYDDLVKEAIKSYPSLFKGSGAGGGGKLPSEGGGGSGVTKKSDLKTEKEKAAFVDKHGLDAYKALPA